jgi:hypothetical protein
MENSFLAVLTHKDGRIMERISGKVVMEGMIMREGREMGRASGEC